MNMPQSPAGGWLCTPTSEAHSFWDWVQWAAGEDEVLAPQDEKVSYRIENTFVKVDRPAEPVKDDQSDGASTEPRPVKDDQSDGASTAEGASTNESDSTAATEEDALTRHKDFVVCKALTSPELKSPRAARAGRTSRTKRSASAPPKVRVSVTLMLRNLPNRAKPQRVEEHLNSLGYFEFTLHLPIDARTGVNKGYCFVRLDDSLAEGMCEKVDGTQLGSGSKKKLCAVIAESQDRIIRRAK